jgi:hypothetical protein
MGPAGRIAAVFLVVVATACLGVATTAGAKKKHHKKQTFSSSITLDAASATGISGRVSAKGKSCTGQRQVGLYKVNSQDSLPTNEYVTSTWTKGDGSWSFPTPQYPGLYFAEVSTKTIPKNRRHGAVVCRFAVSNGMGFS